MSESERQELTTPPEPTKPLEVLEKELEDLLKKALEQKAADPSTRRHVLRHAATIALLRSLATPRRRLNSRVAIVFALAASLVVTSWLVRVPRARLDLEVASQVARFQLSSDLLIGARAPLRAHFIRGFDRVNPSRLIGEKLRAGEPVLRVTDQQSGLLAVKEILVADGSTVEVAADPDGSSYLFTVAGRVTVRGSLSGKVLTTAAGPADLPASPFEVTAEDGLVIGLVASAEPLVLLGGTPIKGVAFESVETSDDMGTRFAVYSTVDHGLIRRSTPGKDVPVSRGEWLVLPRFKGMLGDITLKDGSVVARARGTSAGIYLGFNRERLPNHAPRLLEVARGFSDNHGIWTSVLALFGALWAAYAWSRGEKR